jgi:geranylgeranyl reductase family protein
MEPTYDLIIAGAGPAGASCARRAAELGLSVLAFEKVPFPRPKPCAAGLTSKALRWFGDELAPVIHDEVSVVRLVVSSGVEVVWDGGGVVVATTSRRELDQLLADRAAEVGARIEFGVRVESVETTETGASMLAGGHTHRARHLVAADGPEGVVRRACGMPRVRLTGAIYIHAFPDETGELERYRGELVFDFTEHRRGYGWVFPKRDHLNVGVYGKGLGGGSLRRSLRSLLESLGLSEWRTEGPFAFPIPCSTGKEHLSHGRVLFAGDAAGLADPITGEGISHAIASGRIAAESIAESLGIDAVTESGGSASGSAAGLDAAGVYRRRIMREVVPEVNGMRPLGNLLYALGPRVIGTVARAPLLREMLVRRRMWQEFESKGGRLRVETPARDRHQ